MLVCACVGGGGGGGECEEDQNSSISLHVSEMFKLLGAFTPEMPIALSFLDSVLCKKKNYCEFRRSHLILLTFVYRIPSLFFCISRKKEQTLISLHE